MLAIPVLIYACIQIQSIWFHRQPLEYHLRNTFKESGFEVPDYVTVVEGSKGHVDFQGDYAASVSFIVNGSDVNRFMKLPSEVWDAPESFSKLESDQSCGDFVVPAGAFLIAEEPQGSEYRCIYAVDPASSRIYFYRASW